MASDQSWKEKYLQELESADNREKQWKAERNTLERMLVRTSLASEGQTPELDRLLARIRKDLRMLETAARPRVVRGLPVVRCWVIGENRVASCWLEHKRDDLVPTMLCGIRCVTVCRFDPHPKVAEQSLRFV